MRFTPAIVTSLAVGLAVALAAGCVGNIDNTEPQGGVDGGVTTAQGRTLYKQNVHPVMNRCTGTACHSVGGTGGGQSKFADASGDISYDAIVKAPLIVGTFTSTAGVLTKIAGGHNGITYSAPEISSITAWLAKESTERNGTNQPPPVDPVQALKTWSGCMSLTNFQTAKMAQQWGSLAASNNQRCMNCHQAGLYVFIATTVEQQFFDTITQHKDYLMKYFTVDATGKVIINTNSFTNAGVTLASHPHFNPTTNQGMTALQTFYDSTVARQTAGTCDPARLVD